MAKVLRSDTFFLGVQRMYCCSGYVENLRVEVLIGLLPGLRQRVSKTESSTCIEDQEFY